MLEAEVVKIHYTTTSPVRAILVDKKGRQEMGPVLKKYVDAFPEKVDNTYFRFKVRLLFKRIKEVIGDCMCYVFRFVEDKFELLIKDREIAKKLGISHIYIGSSISEIYLSLSKEMSYFLEKFDNQILQKATY